VLLAWDSGVKVSGGSVEVPAQSAVVVGP
jgi:hypothetical protein